MTSSERREARYNRRKARREQKRTEKLKPHDDFFLVADTDNLYSTFQRAMRGVAWKESVQRFEANALRNIAGIRRKLLAIETDTPRIRGRARSSVSVFSAKGWRRANSIISVRASYSPRLALSSRSPREG